MSNNTFINEGSSYRTLTLLEAAKLLGAHQETVRVLAKSGNIPGAKIGKCWLFLEDDLVTYIRSKYSGRDVSQGVTVRSNKKWHSTKETVSGGSTFVTKDREYAKALGLL